MKPPNSYRRALFICVASPIVTSGFIAFANWWIIHTTSGRIFTDLNLIPGNDVALVLGTSKSSGRGAYSNPFFEGRMNAAAALFHAGKVRHLLVSGDNDRTNYDEPTWMRDALISRGVPRNAVTLDYAGFRTLDSMARAEAVFGLQKLTIVTDDFHQPRSVFLATAQGLDAVGFTSERVPWQWSKKTRLREIVSRARACVDIYVLHTKPKFFGPKVEIEPN